MSYFEPAVEFVLRHEGGLSENPHDSGGITNGGISLRFLREVKEESLRRYGIFIPVTEQTIRDLTLDQIRLIYKGEFWEGNYFEEIESQTLCDYMFDMVIHHGLGTAIKLIQRATWAATFTRNYIKDDGIIGPKTVGALNLFGEELLPIMVAMRADFCRVIVANRPKDEVFLDGWLNRCYDLDNR